MNIVVGFGPLCFANPPFNLSCFTGPTCDYGVISGISDSSQGIEPGSRTSVFRKHQSYLINSGLDGRIYWFYFFKLAQRSVYGDAIPKFTTEEIKATLDARANDHITPALKFRQLLNDALSYNAMPLQEYVSRRWYFGRIIIVGDAAHKVSRHKKLEVSLLYANCLVLAPSYHWPQ